MASRRRPRAGRMRRGMTEYSGVGQLGSSHQGELDSSAEPIRSAGPAVGARSFVVVAFPATFTHETGRGKNGSALGHRAAARAVARG
jgi:hypothetical protein